MDLSLISNLRKEKKNRYDECDRGDNMVATQTMLQLFKFKKKNKNMVL